MPRRADGVLAWSSHPGDGRGPTILRATVKPSSPRKRRTKIVCTLGPATSDPAAVAGLIDGGMDVARLNFSHGTHEVHGRSIRLLRRLARERNRSIAILQDLQGPKIRTGALEGGEAVFLRAGQQLVITTKQVEGNTEVISTTFAALSRELEPGNRLLLSDGLIELRVEQVGETEVTCRVVNGGRLEEHQGINLPGVPLRLSAITEKDERDLRFGIDHGVDYVALSFVRCADDVRSLRRLLDAANSSIQVVAKLEKPEAIENLAAILEISDAVMVARGDLGVELSPERVPSVQKTIIRAANQRRVPVITATQMLESMIRDPRPTRAEVSDVANAVFDGTDAVMLSGETAVGDYPVQALQMMARIALEAESSRASPVEPPGEEGRLSVPETVCRSIAAAARSMDLRAVIVFTQSGSTARLVSMYRPPVPIYAFSPNREILRRTALYWGVHSLWLRKVGSIERMIEKAEARLLEEKLVDPGDLVAIAAGAPIGARGSTNLMELHRVGRM